MNSTLLTPEGILVTLTAACGSLALGLIAWQGRRALEKLDRTAEAVQRVETQLSGSDGLASIQAELAAIREWMRSTENQTHDRVREWATWRAVKEKEDTRRDDRLDDHAGRISTIERHPALLDTPPQHRRTTRRRKEDQ